MEVGKGVVSRGWASPPACLGRLAYENPFQLVGYFLLTSTEALETLFPCLESPSSCKTRWLSQMYFCIFPNQAICPSPPLRTASPQNYLFVVGIMCIIAKKATLHLTPYRPLAEGQC